MLTSFEYWDLITIAAVISGKESGEAMRIANELKMYRENIFEKELYEETTEEAYSQN